MRIRAYRFKSKGSNWARICLQPVSYLRHCFTFGFTYLDELVSYPELNTFN